MKEGSAKAVDANNLESSSKEEEEEGSSSVLHLHWNTYAVVGSCVFGIFATIFTLGVTGFWTKPVEEDLGGAELSLWLSQAFQLISAVVSPIYGRIGDSIGRKYLVLVAMLLCMAGNGIIAGATSMNMAIAGSCVFGIGFSAQGQFYAIAAEVLPRRHRGSASIANQVGACLGVIVGCMAGSGFVKNHPGSIAGWRGIYWCAFALHGVVFILFLFLYHPQVTYNPENLSVATRLMRIDWVGAFLLAGFVAPLMMGVIWGGAVYPWSDAHCIATLVIGCVFAVLLGVHQVFFKKDGIFSHAMFQNRNMPLSLSTVFVAGMVYISFNFLYAKESEILWEQEPVLSALRFACFMIAGLAILPIMYWYVYTFRSVKPVLLLGYCFFFAGVLGLLLATPGTYQAAIAYCVFAGIGFQGPVALPITIAQLAVPKEFAATAASLVLASRAIGGAIGTAGAQAAYTNKLSTKLPGYVTKAANDYNLEASSIPQVIEGLKDGLPEKVSSATGMNSTIEKAVTHAYLQAQADSFKFGWAVVLPFVVVAGLAILALKPVKKEMNQYVDAALKEETEKNKPMGGEKEVA